MNLRTALAALIVPMGLLSVNACEFPTACEGLSASDKDREAAANGYEVERQDNSGNTCELSQDGNSWEVDN